MNPVRVSDLITFSLYVLIHGDLVCKFEQSSPSPTSPYLANAPNTNTANVGSGASIDLADDDRSGIYKMSKRNIQIGEDKDPVSGEPKGREVNHNSANEESSLGKFNEIPPDENCGHQPSRPTPASVLSEPETESEGAASTTADRAKPTAEHAASISSIPATTHQTSEPVRTGSSIFTRNEFRNRASDSPRDNEASLEYRHSPLSKHGSIRLLRLMPHKDKKAPIQCQLFEYPLQELGEGTHLYEALSYVWGSEDNRQPVYIQSDDKVTVTPLPK